MCEANTTVSNSALLYFPTLYQTHRTNCLDPWLLLLPFVLSSSSSSSSNAIEKCHKHGVFKTWWTKLSALEGIGLGLIGYPDGSSHAHRRDLNLVRASRK